MEIFIRSKYETRRWALEGNPPEDPSVLDVDGAPVAQTATQIQQNIGTKSTPVTQLQRAEPSHRRSMSDGGSGKPLHDPAPTSAQKVGARASFREPVPWVEIRALPICANDPLPVPQTSILDPDPMSLDVPPSPTRSEDLIREPSSLPPTPGSLDRKTPTEPLPVPEPLPSESLAVQNPPDPPQPRSESYTPLEAVDPHDAGDTATTTLRKIGTPLARLRQSFTGY